ncbi:MAG TPA: heavy-metal-associated domain-containing protein [Candidatus Rubneribacter avistercoris]|nr:heavy-metal-associated domain-containing protein [Candidatus Rubneribacter avistercoris]
MVRKTVRVRGMHCPKCDARVEKAVGAVAGVESVRADHESDEVEMAYDGAPETLAAVRAAIAA